MGHQREIPCGPEGRLEEVQFGGLRRKGNMWGKRKSEDKLEAQAIKLMVACSEITQDLKKLHSNEEMANIQTRNTEVATPWKAIPSSVRWREDSPRLGTEGCTTSCSSLCPFPRQLRRSLLQCTRWFCPPLYSIQKGRRLLPWRMRQLLTG